jgi:hypothetical protein
MNKGARRGRTIGMKCGCVVDKTPFPEFWLPERRLNPRGKPPHVTEVIERWDFKDNASRKLRKSETCFGFHNPLEW